MSFDDLQKMQMAAEEPEQPAAPTEEAPLFSAETTAFDDLQRTREEAPAAPEPELAQPSPLESPEVAEPELAAPEAPVVSPSFGFAEEPKVVPFEPPQPLAFTPPEPEPEPVYSAETTAFPKMSFDDLQRMREESEAPAPPAVEELPWTSTPAPLIGGAPASEAEPGAAPIPFAPPIPEAAPVAPAERAGALSDEEVDRIARRVVELMSDKAVRDIAWEVIPDLAQSIVRERIRELEKEEA